MKIKSGMPNGLQFTELAFIVEIKRKNYRLLHDNAILIDDEWHLVQGRYWSAA